MKSLYLLEAVVWQVRLARGFDDGFKSYFVNSLFIMWFCEDVYLGYISDEMK